MRLSYYTNMLSFFLCIFLFAACGNNNRQNEMDNRRANEDLTRSQELTDNRQQLLETDNELEQEIEEFKQDTREEINENREEIDRIKTDLNNQGTQATEQMRQEVAALEAKNTELQNDLNNAQAPTREDWEAFKENFNRELEELGDEISSFFDQDDGNQDNL